MSLVNHAAWPALAPYVRIEEHGGGTRPRRRIEFARTAPVDVTILALGLVVPCAACGRYIQCFRARVSKSKRSHHEAIYFAAACPLDVSIGCSRGHEAKKEYDRVTMAVEARQLARVS